MRFSTGSLSHLGPASRKSPGFVQKQDHGQIKFGSERIPVVLDLATGISGTVWALLSSASSFSASSVRSNSGGRGGASNRKNSGLQSINRHDYYSSLFIWALTGGCSPWVAIDRQEQPPSLEPGMKSQKNWDDENMAEDTQNSQLGPPMATRKQARKKNRPTYSCLNCHKRKVKVF